MVARCESLVVIAVMLLCLDAKVLTAIVMVAQLEVNCGIYLRNKISTVYGSY